MSTRSSLMNNMSVQEQATFWFLRLQSEDTRCEERDAFAEWLVSDPAHSDVYFQLESLWDNLEPVVDTREVKQGFLRAESMAKTASRKRVLRAFSYWAAAAAVIAAVALNVFLDDSVIYQTEVGELRIVTLEDGSSVTLNTNTSLEVNYNRNQRLLTLNYGQADFQVAQASDRPFVVIAGGGAVQALGTRFDIYKTGDKITVTLMDGKVRVAPIKEPHLLLEPRLTQPLRTTELTPGEQISYDQKALVALPVTNVDVRRVSAWQRRRLDFFNTPLKDVVNEANRYSALKIELLGESLRERRMTGIFEAGKSNDVVAAIQAYFGVEVNRTLSNRIILTERKSNK